MICSIWDHHGFLIIHPLLNLFLLILLLPSKGESANAKSRKPRNKIAEKSDPRSCFQPDSPVVGRICKAKVVPKDVS